MTGLTQYEFALALIIAGVLLLMVRHWKWVAVFMLALLFLKGRD